MQKPSILKIYCQIIQENGENFGKYAGKRMEDKLA
jgi:hypothetical protein